MFFNKKNNSSKKYTVDQALYQLGYGTFQQNISILSGAGIGLGTFQIITNIILIPQIKEIIFEINKNSKWINYTSFIFLGLIIGSLFWTHIGNKYGRKKASIYSVFLNFFNNILLLFIPISFIWIIINSFILGFSLGTTISTDIQMLNDFTLYQEIKSNHLSGLIYWIVLSGTIGYLTSALTLSKLNWKICILISASLSLTLLISRIKWLYDSPRFLIREHKLYSAADTLYIISEKNKTQLPSGTLESYSKENVINEYNSNPLECFSFSQLKNNLIFIIITYTFSFTIFSILTSIHTILNQNQNLSNKETQQQESQESQESSINKNSTSILLFIDMLFVTITLFSLSLTSILPINKKIMSITSFVMSTFILIYGLSSSWGVTLITSMLLILSFFLAAFCLLIQAINNSSQKQKLSVISMMGYCLVFAGLTSTLISDIIQNYVDPTNKWQFLICSIQTGITTLLVIKTRKINEITRIISINNNDEFIPKKDHHYFNKSGYHRIGNNDNNNNNNNNNNSSNSNSNSNYNYNFTNDESEIKILYNE